MNINITGRNIEITDAIREFVNKKFSKLTRKLHDPLKADLVLNIENKNSFAEFNSHINHQEINLSETHTDMYVAINQLVKKLDRKLNEIKSKN